MVGIFGAAKFRAGIVAGTGGVVRCGSTVFTAVADSRFRLLFRLALGAVCMVGILGTAQCSAGIITGTGGVVRSGSTVFGAITDNGVGLGFRLTLAFAVGFADRAAHGLRTQNCTGAGCLAQALIRMVSGLAVKAKCAEFMLAMDAHTVFIGMLTGFFRILCGNRQNSTG